MVHTVLPSVIIISDNHNQNVQISNDENETLYSLNKLIYVNFL